MKVMRAFIVLENQGIDLLTPIVGKPAVWHMLDALRSAGIKEVTLVGSLDQRTVSARLSCILPYELALDISDSATRALEACAPDADVLIVSGLMPLLTAETVVRACDFYFTNNKKGVVCALRCPGKHEYDRVSRKGDMLHAIIERHDSRWPHRLKKSINYLDAGLYLFKGSVLAEGLKLFEEKGRLVDFCAKTIPNTLSENGTKVMVCRLKTSFDELRRVTTHVGLADSQQAKRMEINSRHMASGVRIIDPATTYIDLDVEIGQGVVIYPGVMLEGACRIGELASIGPYSHISNSSVGSGSSVRFSVVADSEIMSEVTVGPYAYLRMGAKIGDNCRIGNFVEVKNSQLNIGVKMAHLAYIGDADVGKGVNYSCGAITCNYDGKKKHRTVIGDGAFIGSNVNLVAPVDVGKDAFVAAGSTITRDVDENALAIARQRQTQKNDRGMADRS